MSDQVVAQVTRLTSGYVLSLGDGRTIACTDEAKLAKYIKESVATVDVPVTPPPPTADGGAGHNPPTAGGGAGHSHMTVTPDPAHEKLIHVAPKAIQGDVIQNPEWANLTRIAEAIRVGEFESKDLPAGLAKYCPSIDPKQAEAVISEYLAQHRGQES